jgi:DNA helicase IV
LKERVSGNIRLSDPLRRQRINLDVSELGTWENVGRDVTRAASVYVEKRRLQTLLLNLLSYARTIDDPMAVNKSVCGLVEGLRSTL